jgi:FG-GAP repeat
MIAQGSTGRAGVSRRVAVATALACVALGALVHQGLPAGILPSASGVRSQTAPREGLLSLPLVAQGPVSAALGRDEPAYRIAGLAAHNPAQRFSAQFGRSRVAITAGSARIVISVKAYGRASTLRALASVSPVASADQVSYARGPVREWWANGPLGLEQGFDIARRPAGSGALTLSLAVSGSARLDHGTVLLPGGLRYAGLQATDARGRSLRAWLQVRDGRVLVRVNDRGARYPLRIDPTVQQAELDPSDGAGCNGNCGDEFGYSVATSGNTVVVGSPFHEANSQVHGGAVYVFQKPAAGWASATQTAELTDSALGGHVELGYSVAISSDGDTIVAGAPAGSEIAGNGVNSQGTVDVFTTSGGWTSTSTPTARLTVAGSPTTESSLGGELGWSVAISGTTIVAGAPYDATSPSFGEAYVFTMPPGGWVSGTQVAELSASDPSNPNGDEYFGWSVGVSGATIVVGAWHQAPAGGVGTSGEAYVFTMPPGGWANATQTAKLTANDPGGSDEFGWSVAASPNTVVVGAPNHEVGSNPGQGAAYVYVMPAAGPWVNATQTAELSASDGQTGDELGWSVAISGNTIVAGARARQVETHDGQGAVYEWTQPAGGWVSTSADSAELTAGDGSTDDSLGESVAVSGTTVAAGAPRHYASSSTEDHGAAYVFGPESEGSPGGGGSTGGGATGEGPTGGGTTTGGGGTSSGGGTSTGPPPTEATPTPVPAPQLAATANVAQVSGTVSVRLPGSTTFVPLASLRQIPFGSVIEATHGHVSVTTASPHGGTQTGEFFEGEFVLTQGRNGVVVAALTGGDFSVCPTARERAHKARASAAHASGKHVVRKLWANAHGSFSTKGNYAAGAVAGTEWLTEDLCDGTMIRVTRDKVAVTNLVTHRHVLVKVGHSYLAKAP